MLHIRILVLEDSIEDAELIIRELDKSEKIIIDEWKRVETEAEFVQFLNHDRTWDVILVDAKLPQMSALRALELLKATDLDTPMVLVTGTFSVEAAYVLAERGMNGWMLKEFLWLLPAVIAQVIRESRLRMETRRLERELEALRSPLQNICSLIKLYAQLLAHGKEDRLEDYAVILMQQIERLENLIYKA